MCVLSIFLLLFFHLSFIWNGPYTFFFKFEGFVPPATLLSISMSVSSNNITDLRLKFKNCFFPVCNVMDFFATLWYIIVCMLCVGVMGRKKNWMLKVGYWMNYNVMCVFWFSASYSICVEKQVYFRDRRKKGNHGMAMLFYLYNIMFSRNVEK